MITIHAVLKAKEGREEELREHLLRMVKPSLLEEGCKNYILHESTNQNGIFIFYETWKNEQSLNSHVQTSHYKEYRRNTEDLLDKREVYRLNIIS